jgi:hypothetical protein
MHAVNRRESRDSRLHKAALRGVCVLLLFSSAARPADEGDDLDEVAATFVQIIRSVEADFDCLIKVVALEEPDDKQSDLRYFATYVAAGVECPEASDELGIRGVRHGIVFFRGESSPLAGVRGESSPLAGESNPPKILRRHEPTHRILDLIHEIDPPMDE